MKWDIRREVGEKPMYKIEWVNRPYQNLLSRAWLQFTPSLVVPIDFLIRRYLRFSGLMP